MAELKPVLAGSTSLSPIGASSSSCIFSRKQPLYPCSIADALVSDISNSVLLETFSPVAVYGSVGFVSLSLVASTPETRPLWKQCTNLCYCDGPSYEGNTVGEFDRYKTRWLFQFDSGLLSYGVVGEPLVRLLSLFPTAVEYDSFSACFDQNAKPVVVFGLGTTVELRRTQAGVYTSYSFTGESPVLFLNALLQRDLAQQDVVCYYLRNGNLCGRWQRDNFEVEHVLVTDVEVDSLFSVRTSTLSYKQQEFLFCQKSCSTRLITSDSYPLWPFVVRESPVALIATPAGGTYSPVTITFPLVSETLGLVATPAGGEYVAIRITFPTVHESLVLSAAPAPSSTGSRYWSIRMDAGTYHESINLSAAPATTGNRYWLVRVDVGTYHENISLSATPAGGTYAAV